MCQIYGNYRGRESGLKIGKELWVEAANRLQNGSSGTTRLYRTSRFAAGPAKLGSVNVWEWKAVGSLSGRAIAIRKLKGPLGFHILLLPRERMQRKKVRYARRIFQCMVLLVGLQDGPIIWMEVTKYEFDCSCRMTYCQWPSSGFDYRSNTWKWAGYDLRYAYFNTWCPWWDCRILLSSCSVNPHPKWLQFRHYGAWGEP